VYWGASLCTNVTPERLSGAAEDEWKGSGGGLHTPGGPPPCCCSTCTTRSMSTVRCSLQLTRAAASKSVPLAVAIVGRAVTSMARWAASRSRLRCFNLQQGGERRAGWMN